MTYDKPWDYNHQRTPVRDRTTFPKSAAPRQNNTVLSESVINVKKTEYNKSFFHKLWFSTPFVGLYFIILLPKIEICWYHAVASYLPDTPPSQSATGKRSYGDGKWRCKYFLISGEDMQRQRLQSWGTAMVINTLDTNHKTRHKNWGSESLVVPSCLQLWDTVEFFEQNGTIETTIDTVVTLCLIFHLKISFNL